MLRVERCAVSGLTSTVALAAALTLFSAWIIGHMLCTPWLFLVTVPEHLRVALDGDLMIEVYSIDRHTKNVLGARAHLHLLIYSLLFRFPWFEDLRLERGLARSLRLATVRIRRVQQQDSVHHHHQEANINAITER